MLDLFLHPRSYYWGRDPQNDAPLEGLLLSYGLEPWALCSRRDFLEISCLFRQPHLMQGDSL